MLWSLAEVLPNGVGYVNTRCRRWRRFCRLRSLTRTQRPGPLRRSSRTKGMILTTDYVLKMHIFARINIKRRHSVSLLLRDRDFRQGSLQAACATHLERACYGVWVRPRGIYTVDRRQSRVKVTEGPVSIQRWFKFEFYLLQGSTSLVVYVDARYDTAVLTS